MSCMPESVHRELQYSVRAHREKGMSNFWVSESTEEDLALPPTTVFCFPAMHPLHHRQPRIVFDVPPLYHTRPIPDTSEVHRGICWFLLGSGALVLRRSVIKELQ